MTNENNLFAERLKEAMDSRKLSAAKLSRLSGVSKSSLSRYIGGSYKANAKHSVMLAKALGVTEAWLMGSDGTRDNKPVTNVSADDRPTIIKMAIEALEKQIPKKVKERCFEMASCSACGTTVLDIEKYCPHCGQALDWSEE